MTNKTNIYQKLHKAKDEIGVITKDAKNPFFKSSYLSLNGLLDAVEDVLQKNELVLLQPLENGNVTTEIIDIESKEKVSSSIQLPTITDPQKLGSAITYFRRYTLQSLLGLQADDDDGNLASKPAAPKKEVTPEIDNSDRKPNLTADQFQKTVKSTNGKAVQTVLNKYRMSPEQREVLEHLLAGL